MAVINDNNIGNSLTGSNGEDTITGNGGDDTISGRGGNDVLYGDYGPEGTEAGSGQDASALDLTASNARNESADGTTVEYRNIAFLDDGTAVMGKLTLVSTSDADLDVDLTGGNGSEILVNSSSDRSMAGETATIRLEFFNQETGEPISINTTGTFADIDQTRTGTESVTISKEFVTSVAVSDGSDIDVDTSGSSYVATGTRDTNPNDQDAWFSTQLEDQQFIEFTVTARGSPAGYTFNGDLIDDPVIIPNEPGDDSIDGGDGDDLIYGNDGNDTLNGGNGDDTLIGGDGDDLIKGGDGDDSIVAGDGTDTVHGGDGNDTIRGGGENDNLNGGDDADTIILDTFGSNLINNTNVNGGSGGDDNDTLDLSAMLSEGWSVSAHVKNAETNGQPGFNGQITLVDPTSLKVANINYTDIENVVICFTPGTMIATPTGERPVEELRAGDRVFTRDNGVQEIRWTGNRGLSPAELEADPALRPIRIKAGALGNNMPERDIMVSPSHRMLMANERTSMYFEDREVLAAAKHLTKLKGVSKVNPGQGVVYHHVLFDHHEVILGNGAWTESFQPGDYSLGGMRSSQRDEIVKLFPQLATAGGRDAYAAARRTLKRQETDLLAG